MSGWLGIVIVLLFLHLNVKPRSGCMVERVSEFMLPSRFHFVVEW